MIAFDDFLEVDMRVGRIVEVDDFPEARKPAWKLTIDFGHEIGVKRSSAQITNYSRDELERPARRRRGQLPAAPDRPVRSEVLTLGASDEDGHVILLAPDARRPARRADPLAGGSSPMTFRRRSSAFIANARVSATVTPNSVISSSPPAIHFG